MKKNKERRPYRGELGPPLLMEKQSNTTLSSSLRISATANGNGVLGVCNRQGTEAARSV